MSVYTSTKFIFKTSRNGLHFILYGRLTDKHKINQFIIYLQSERIEKYRFELCSKYDTEHDFDVILEHAVPCRKLRWICCRRSNDVVRQDHQVSQQFLSRDRFVC